MKKVKIRAICIGILGAILLVGCTSNIKDGIMYLEADNYEAAGDAFEKDITEKKNLDEAYRGLGIAQYELGNYTEAAKALEDALENGTKETATIYNMLGASYLQVDEYETALEYYDKALGMKDCKEPIKQEILFNQIAIYQQLGDWDTLKEKVFAYVENYPDDKRMDKTVEFLETR